MMQAQIVPQYVNPPQNPQWANGSVKDTGGQRWFVPKGSLGLFQPNTPANITYEQKIGQKGQPYNVVTAVNGQPVGGNMQQAGQAFQAPARPAGPAQQPDTKSEDMFVMGVVGRAMGSGNFGVTDVDLLVKAAVEAWHGRHSTKQNTGGDPRDELDDGWPGPDV